jgi:hypothetical protein
MPDGFDLPQYQKLDIPGYGEELNGLSSRCL